MIGLSRNNATKTTTRRLPVGVGRVLGRLAGRARSGRLLATAVIPVLLLVRVADPAPIEALRLRVFDAYQAWYPRASTSDSVVIADIDERSLTALGQWPWARTRVAQLLDELRSGGARAIGLDIVFAEPDRLSPDLLAAEVPQLEPQARARLLALPSNDARLAEALVRTRSVLGQTAVSDATPPAASGPWTGIATLGPGAAAFLPRYPGLLRNVPALERAAAGRGLFTIAPERDGVVRRVPTVLNIGGRLAPSLTIELLRVLTGAPAILIRSDANGIKGVALPHIEIPTDPLGRIWVPFARHEPGRYVSVVDILNGTIPRGRLAGKIVLVGTSAIGLLDNKTTPLERTMPGVEVHAQLLEGALSGMLLREPGNALALGRLAAAGLTMLIVVLAPMLGPVALLVASACLASVLLATSLWLYRSSGLLFDPSFPLGAGFIVFALITFANYARESAQRRRIRSAFAQYLSPDLVDELCRSDEALTLGGQTRHMSVLFSDVRGFTAIAEGFKNDPQGLSSLMNRLLTPLSAAIIENRGTVDKYMGDAVMAFWNAPLADADHEGNSCRAALAMLERLDQLNEARLAEDAQAAPLAIGVGINTGECVVGNMGSDLRFDYSVLGDSVNLASRLEGQAKPYGVRVLLGDATAAAVLGRFALLEVDLLQVKGKSEPERVWTLIGDEALAASDLFIELASHHASMISAFRDGKLERAALHLAACRLAAPALKLDGLYAFFAARLDERRALPEGAVWTEVRIATAK